MCSARQLPNVDDSAVDLLVLGQWRTPPAAQSAALDGSSAAWDDVEMPPGMLSHTAFAAEEPDLVVHVSLATNLNAYKTFDKHRWATVVDQHVAGIQRISATPYRRYRSVHTDQPGSPGCVVMVHFEAESAHTAREWIDNLITASTPATAPPGMLSAHFHIATDGTRILNYAEWTDTHSHQQSVADRSKPENQPVIAVVDTAAAVKHLHYQRFTDWHTTTPAQTPNH
ncbi:hypothetical protein A5746_05165 [Mycolicibacterium conceptionense]|jgi:hypothetical protein|uniref:Antibiotic biosynthesis monooxygenase n=1 Tax=Mycolicibacterium conceptionense TaxID=451644 RepID=A0A0U1CY63_9MYCO|nr:antibiotic biosynthesis monooxygenase [Mycolicibacterium conceptionense]OBK08721.1 hypothetical protein A5639_12740 [Mycolicibacterium conceptionense]OMB79215.1 hypothetical protein A5741_28070 [Mycolicibacterium conceptionense]OMB81423.1 hypothetical protein A5746_05165 [Mycolicibacterium conceptionense]ORV26271.1 hypothetical protein AWB98_15545 [Mycolicibacterium conceptionense]CQD04440.1 Antibiotic biosynthesis monooxygenase [Mycolicibacterium conceptionense]